MSSVESNWELWIILAVAFALRVWDLDIKPPHFDEGINGHFVSQMWRDGFYRYDPTNFHGPLYFYVLQIAELLFGRSITAYRFVNGLISVGLIAVIAMHRRFFGKAAIWAALIVALSPAFVFYSRYAIHETLFVLLHALFTYGFFLWREEKSKTAAALMAAGFFGSFTVKETFFIFFGTWAIALACVKLADRIFPVRKTEIEKAVKPQRQPATREELWGITGLAIFLVAVLFSGFFMNPKGLGDMFTAFAFWTKTGTGPTGHEKPFLYWLRLLWTYEIPSLIALVMAPVVFFFVGRRERIMVLTSIGTWLAYSLIPYKTPWLIMNMLWPLAFVLGFALMKAKEIGSQRWLMFFRPAFVTAVLVATCVSTFTMLRLNFKDYANGSESYVYVQSTLEFKHAMDWIQERVRTRPETLNMQIRVLSADPWPMPWTLGRFPNLQWGKPESANLENADIVLVDASKRALIEPKLIGKYWVAPFQIRESYEKGFAFFEFDRFQGIVPSNLEIFERKPGGQP